MYFLSLRVHLDTAYFAKNWKLKIIKKYKKVTIWALVTIHIPDLKKKEKKSWKRKRGGRGRTNQTDATYTLIKNNHIILKRALK